MGSEERGISSSVLKLSDEIVKLPMFGKDTRPQAYSFEWPSKELFEQMPQDV